jgi:GNAT superfamily N-acetyltransferase
MRPMTPADRGACLAVFDSNVPGSFIASERASFESFLDALAGPYFVLEDASGGVVACGGYAVTPGTRTADLCWGMVTRERQGTGLGRVLTERRLARIREDVAVGAVALETSQHTRAFYERLGFVATQVEHDGIAPGLHRCVMRLDIERE